MDLVSFLFAEFGKKEDRFGKVEDSRAVEVSVSRCIFEGSWYF